MPEPTPVTDLVSVVIALLAFGVALYQVWWSQKESARRAAFEHLRELDQRLKPLWHHRPAHLHASVLSAYRGEAPLAPEGADFLAFLNAMDLLALGVEERTVEAPMARTYLRSIFNSSLIDPRFFADFQKCCNDEEGEVYRHLFKLWKEYKRQTPATRSSYGPEPSWSGWVQQHGGE
jgi:hypothetical protein